MQPGTTCLRGTCAEILYHLPPQLSVFLHDQQQQEQQLLLGNPHSYRSELPCVIRLVHHCEYGEHFGLLGNCEQMGNWDPAKAVPLKVGPGGQAARALVHCQRLCRQQILSVARLPLRTVPQQPSHGQLLLQEAPHPAPNKHDPHVHLHE